MRYHPEVSAFVAGEQERLRKSAQITCEELVTWLCAVIRTPIGELDTDSPLVQEFSANALRETVIRTRVKMVGKLEACKQLAALMGWNEPEQIKIDATDRLAGLLQKIRER